MGMKAVVSRFKTKESGGPSVRLGKRAVEEEIIKSKSLIFNHFGHVTFNSISSRREFFLGKSAARLENELRKKGYETQRRPSVRRNSKAKVIIVLNPSKDRNITQIQVSPGSKRHGGVGYVKISTLDIGKIKIINGDPKNYKTDGKETARLLFRRKRK